MTVYEMMQEEFVSIRAVIENSENNHQQNDDYCGDDDELSDMGGSLPRVRPSSNRSSHMLTLL